MSQPPNVWGTTPEIIEDLAAFISLRRRANDAHAMKQAEQISKMNEEIHAMRQHVRDDRREVAKSLFNDEQVITHALADEKQLQLACKGLDVRTAAIKLNEDVFVRHKWLNYLRHQRMARERRLEAANTQLQATSLHEQSTFQQADDKSLRILMTKLDKMVMKRNTASFIQGHYREALEKLNKDSLTLSKDLDYIERAVKLSKFEALDLREIYQAAKQGQEVARAKRLELEQNVFLAKQQRDKIISETRQQAKQAAEMPEFAAVRTPVDLGQGGKERATKTFADKPSHQLDKLSPVIKIITTVTNTGLAEEIPKAFNRQVKNRESLETQSSEVTEKLTEQKRILKKAQNDLEFTQFNQKETARILQAEIEAAKEEINNNTQRLQTRRSSDTRQVEYVVNFNDALDGMLAKIIGAGLLEIDDVTKLSMTEKLELIRKAAEELKQAQHENESEVEAEFRLDTLLKKVTDSGAQRITITEDEGYNFSDNFIIDDNLNEQYVTRDEIKKPLNNGKNKGTKKK